MSAASGPMCEKSGWMTARPSRRLSRSASRPPPANSTEKRSQLFGAGSASIVDPPRHAEVEAELRPLAVVGLDPDELAAAVGEREAAADERVRDLARLVRAGDVGVAVVDADDLPPEHPLDLLPRSLGLGQLGHA